MMLGASAACERVAMAAATPPIAQAELVRAQAGIGIRQVDEVGDLAMIAALLDVVWGMPTGHSAVPVGVLRAWAFTDNYVAAAFVDDRMVGASAAFVGRDHDDPDRTVLHSHITGVVPDARGQQVGLALKLHQRAWAAERDIDQITWTFDPVVRRNARFNLVKLGAEPSAYLDDFYGVLGDEVNAGQSSDRLLVSWRVSGEERGGVRQPGSGARDRLVDASGSPQVVPVSGGPPELLVALPADIEALRRADPALALAWRMAVREALHTDGYRLAGMSADHRYVLARDD